MREIGLLTHGKLSLKKVPVKERGGWYLMGGGVSWDSCPEVIHVEQILGNYRNFAHELS